jgi:hypothetical protein
MKLLESVFEPVKIAPKTVKYTPIEKLIDAEIAILTGGCRPPLVEKAVRNNQ